LNFRSVAQLSDQLLHWSHRLPADIEVVVGVPRSGLLAANLLALYLNVPLTDVEGLLGGQCFAAGTVRRKRFAGGADASDLGSFLSTSRKVLVVDDSLLSGRSMRAVREEVIMAALPHQVLYAAVYVLPGKLDDVDHYCEELNGPRVFEWNVLHGDLLSRFCVALDGVLCARPTAAVSGDEALYRTFMREARPHLVPAVEIGWIVTERPERYRAETEAWLRANDIRYLNLVMDDQGPGRRSRASASDFKADVYRSTDAMLFLEGSLRQALEISGLTGRDVLCTDSMQLIHAGSLPLPRLPAYGDSHPVRKPPLSRALYQLTRRAVRSALPERALRALRERRSQRR
jgi:orotate phosphoribosyltransferase